MSKTTRGGQTAKAQRALDLVEHEKHARKFNGGLRCRRATAMHSAFSAVYGGKPLPSPQECLRQIKSGLSKALVQAEKLAAMDGMRERKKPGPKPPVEDLTEANRIIRRLRKRLKHAVSVANIRRFREDQELLTYDPIMKMPTEAVEKTPKDMLQDLLSLVNSRNQLSFKPSRFSITVACSVFPRPSTIRKKLEPAMNALGFAYRCRKTKWKCYYIEGLLFPQESRLSIDTAERRVKGLKAKFPVRVQYKFGAARATATLPERGDWVITLALPGCCQEHRPEPIVTEEAHGSRKSWDEALIREMLYELLLAHIDKV